MPARNDREPDRRRTRGRSAFLVIEQGVDSKIDADHAADFFNILPRRIRVKFTQSRVCVAHHGVVVVDGQPRRPSRLRRS